MFLVQELGINRNKLHSGRLAACTVQAGKLPATDEAFKIQQASHFIICMQISVNELILISYLL